MPLSRSRFGGRPVKLRVCVILCCLVLWSSPVLSQDTQATADCLLAEASDLYATGQRSEGSARQNAYEAALRNRDRIGDAFPGSDLSVRILLDDSVGEIDLEEVQRTLAQTADTEVSTDETAFLPAVSEPETRLEPLPSDPASLVQKCFSVTETGDLGDATIILRFTPDDEGRLQGAPVVVAPARPGQAERRLFRLGLAALEQCQPYRQLKAGEPVELVFGATGVAMSDMQRAEAQPTQVGDMRPSEDQIARATDASPGDLPDAIGEYSGKDSTGGALKDGVFPDDAFAVESDDGGETNGSNTELVETETLDPIGRAGAEPEGELLSEEAVGPTSELRKNHKFQERDDIADVHVPAELLALAQRGALTVRGLRGFGLLDAEEDRVMLSLRSRGIDLLGADVRQLRLWVDAGGLDEKSFSENEMLQLRKVILKLDMVEEKVQSSGS